MNTMDTTKLIKTIEQLSLQGYLEKLVHAPLRKVTLFSRFPYTEAPNVSDPHNFVLVDDLAKIAGLNGGECNN